MPTRINFGCRSSLLKRYSALSLLAASALLLSSLSASAQTVSWDASGTHGSAPAGGAGTWGSATVNWSNGSADAAFPSGDTAYFGGTAGSVALTYTPTLSGMNFGVSGYTIGNSSGYGTLNFNTSSTIAYVNTVTGNATETIASAIAGSNLTFEEEDTAQAGSTTFDLSGTNTFTGTLAVYDTDTTTSPQGGTLIVDFFSAASLGSLSTVTLSTVNTSQNVQIYLGTGHSSIDFTSGGTVTDPAIQFNNNTALVTNGVSYSSGSAPITTYGGDLIVDSSSVGARNGATDTVMDFTGNLYMLNGWTTNSTFTYGVAQSGSADPTKAGNFDMGGVISDYINSTTGTAKLSMNYYQTGSATAGQAAGTVFIQDSSNAYTGTTTIRNMTLNVALLANGLSASSLGKSSNVAGNLLIGGNPYYLASTTVSTASVSGANPSAVLSGTIGAQIGSGVLQYTGSSAITTDRLFTVGNGTAVNINNATIDASGTGSGTVAFTNTGALGLEATDPSNSALYLTGSNTGLNTFDPSLANPTSYTSSLVKQGTGTWVLGNTGSTYSGGTTVNNGTLLVDNTGTSGLGTGPVTVIGSNTGVGAVTATLGGTGTIKPTSANTVAVGGDGNLAPGSGSNATTNLTINGSGSTAPYILTLANGSTAPTLTFNLGASGATKQSNELIVSGGVSYFGGSSSAGSGNVVNFNDLTSGALNFGLYTLITETAYTGLTFGTLDPSNTGYEYITGGLVVGTGLSNYTSALEFNTSTDAIAVDITAAPEPSTYALLLGGLGFLIFWHRRSRDSGAGSVVLSDKATKS